MRKPLLFFCLITSHQRSVHLSNKILPTRAEFYLTNGHYADITRLAKKVRKV